MPFDAGLKFERDTIMRLMVGTQSLAQRHVFFAERQGAKIPDVPDDTPTRTSPRSASSAPARWAAALP